MPRERSIKSFYLIVTDKDNGTFSVEGPMTDDRLWNHAVVVAQKLGRQVRCSTASEFAAEDTARNWLNDISGSRCCPGRSSTCREEISLCGLSPCRARQADGVPRSSSRQKRKLLPPTLPHSKPRSRKPRACARFGWPRKQPTRRLQIATRWQRRPLDLRCADMFRGDLRLHVRQNPSKGLVAPSSRRLSPPTSAPRFCLTPSQILEVSGYTRLEARRRDRTRRLVRTFGRAIHPPV